MGYLEEANQIGQDFMVWGRALELQHLASVGITTDYQCFPYLGRAAPPRTRTRPLLHRPRLLAESLQIPGGYGVAAILWATCKALTAKIRTAVRSRAPPHTTFGAKARLLSMTSKAAAGIRSAWGAITSQANRRAGLFAMLIACSPDAARPRPADRSKLSVSCVS